MRRLVLSSLSILLAAGCNIDPAADADGGTSCEPNTALACVGSDHCQGGALCLDGVGYGSCQCLDDGGLVLPDGAVIIPHGVKPSPGADAAEDVDLPDLGSGPPPTVDGKAPPVPGTCDNSEKVAPAP
jgi:hypothetical protein